MFAKISAFLLAVAIATALPGPGRAAVVSSDITVNAAYSKTGTLLSGQTLEFKFKALQALFIDAFSLSATGTNSGNDLNKVTFGYTTPTSDFFDTVVTVGKASFAGDFLVGTIFPKDTIFSIFFEERGIKNPVGVTVSFQTASPVPVPATGLLLGTVLLAAGAFARRSLKAAAGRPAGLLPA